MALNGINSNQLNRKHTQINWHTVRLVVKNNTLKAYINEDFAISDYYEHYKKFERIKIIQTTYADEPIYFRNILGKLIY